MNEPRVVGTVLKWANLWGTREVFRCLAAQTRPSCRARTTKVPTSPTELALPRRPSTVRSCRDRSSTRSARGVVRGARKTGSSPTVCRRQVSPSFAPHRRPRSTPTTAWVGSMNTRAPRLYHSARNLITLAERGKPLRAARLLAAASVELARPGRGAVFAPARMWAAIDGLMARLGRRSYRFMNR